MTPERIANDFLDDWTEPDDLTPAAKIDLAATIRNAIADAIAAEREAIITRLQQQYDSIADIKTLRAEHYRSGLADAIAIVQKQEQPQ